MFRPKCFLYIRFLLLCIKILIDLVDVLFPLCCSYCHMTITSFLFLFLVGIGLGVSSILGICSWNTSSAQWLFLSHTWNHLSLEPWHDIVCISIHFFYSTVSLVSNHLNSTSICLISLSFLIYEIQFIFVLVF